MQIPPLKIDDKAPLVGIGVPVFNGAEFLDECLRSILNQTYKNWLCIILDNCSTDQTNIIAKKYADTDPRFCLQCNSGMLEVMQNWNELFTYIPDEVHYFKIVPADDWLMPDFLIEMVDLMEKHPSIGLCSSFRIDDLRIRGDGLNWYDGNVLEGKNVLVKELLLKIDVTGSGNTVLYRMEHLKRINRFPQIFSHESIHGDTDLAYNLLSFSDFGFIFKVLSFTRRHHGTITDTVASKLNTSICFRDNQMLKYADLIQDFNTNYRKHRRSYALFYLKKILIGDHKSVLWHKNHLRNKIKNREIILGVINYVFIKQPAN
jgi:glycosyltransferase involved in cell wall biosynthesis